MAMQCDVAPTPTAPALSLKGSVVEALWTNEPAHGHSSAALKMLLNHVEVSLSVALCVTAHLHPDALLHGKASSMR